MAMYVKVQVSNVIRAKPIAQIHVLWCRFSLRCAPRVHPLDGVREKHLTSFAGLGLPHWQTIENSYIAKAKAKEARSIIAATETTRGIL